MNRHTVTLCACLTVLLAAACLLLLPINANAATSGYYTYSVYQNQATITDCDTSIKGNITIPSTLGGYPVVAISNYAFCYCSDLTSVTIPSSVTSIKGDAFYGCSSLTTVTIPGSVAEIGDYAFCNCYALKNVTIGEGVSEIGIGAFRSCALTSITLPSTITEIRQQAFIYSSLTDVYFNGTSLQWSKIDIHSDNSYLNKANIFCATTIASSNYPESSHNYTNNLSESKTFTWPGAKRLAITFSSSTLVEANYDYIYIYDGAGTQLAKYTGSAAAGKTLEIPGDTFTVKLTSDGSGVKYGYAFSSILAYTLKHKDHPLCGSKCTCSTSHSSNTWQPWDGTTKMYNGYYYLTQDIVLDSTMILDYSYTSYLCLNGHTITCSNTVFYIYSYRSLLISDCVGTGKIESTGSNATIRNNKYLSVWGGTILNSGPSSSVAIDAYSGTSTYINNGTVTGQYGYGIFLGVGSKVYIQGGTVHGKYGATTANGGNGTPSQMTVSGGRVICDSAYALDIGSGSFTMTGGHVAGINAWNDGAVTISGGTIDGTTDLSCDTASITAGTFGGSLSILGSISDNTVQSVTISGGDFSACDNVTIYTGNTWICGGSFSKVTAYNGSLYLSGVPDIAQLVIHKPGLVSAQSADGSGSFGGDPIAVSLNSGNTTWKDGNVVIRNVKSDTIAKKFVLSTSESQVESLTRYGNDLVLRVLPHGTWGSNASWVLNGDTLTISGTGALDGTYSGTNYPWYPYESQIKHIIVEDGITLIPSYAFEYLGHVTTISLPETLQDLALNAFNDCVQLNNLLLPSSLTTLSGSSNTGYPAFIRCTSLTDVYYLGTQTEWLSLPKAGNVTSHDSTMTMHFLQRYEADATCTTAGVKAHYRFDDTSVYSGYYDANSNSIAQPETIPALGHDSITHTAKAPNCTEVGWEAYETCSRCSYSTYKEKAALGHRVRGTTQVPVDPLTLSFPSTYPFRPVNDTYYSSNSSDNTTSYLDITAKYNCKLTLYYGVSSEPSFDKLIIKLNSVQKDAISGLVEEKSMTLELLAGDKVQIAYTKDNSSSKNQDMGWVRLAYEPVLVTGTGDIPVDTLEPDCTADILCYYCKAVAKKAAPHSTVPHDAKAPTCTEIGWDAYVTCSRCSYSTYAEKSALGHDELPHDAKAPTCTEIGWDAYVTCSRCSYSTYAEKSALGHNELPHNAKAPTCTEIGWDAYVTCSRCSYSTYAEKSALGHDMKEHAAKAPTCIAIGWDAYEACSRCQVSTYTEKAALGHSIEEHAGKLPTCTAIGWDAYSICSRCGGESTYVEKAALGHDIILNKPKAPTCTTVGWDLYETCSRCDHSTFSQKPALGHDILLHEAKAPTVTEAGWDAYETCRRCDHTTFVELPATGIPGDTNGDQRLNNDDVVYLLWHTLFGNEYPLSGNCDFTHDGTLANDDVVYLLWHLLFGDEYPLS